MISRNHGAWFSCGTASECNLRLLRLHASMHRGEIRLQILRQSMMHYHDGSFFFFFFVQGSMFYTVQGCKFFSFSRTLLLVIYHENCRQKSCKINSFFFKIEHLKKLSGKYLHRNGFWKVWHFRERFRNVVENVLRTELSRLFLTMVNNKKQKKANSKREKMMFYHERLTLPF